MILTDANIQVLNGYIPYVDLCLNSSAISFSLTEMAINMVNWARSRANWCLMQLENTSIPRVIAELLKRRASISSLARSRGFCRKTKNTAVHYQMQRSREIALKGHECLQKLQGAKGSEVDEDVHTRLGESTSVVGPSVERVRNIISSPNRTPCLKESCALTETFVTF